MITATETRTTNSTTTAAEANVSTTEVVAGLPSERLEAEIVSLAHRLSTGTYELLVLVGELDARGTWVTFGALSCAAWLADVADIEIATARTQVRVARAMRTHPELNRAMESGDLSYAKARVLVPHLTSEHATELIALAIGVPAGALGAAIAAWSQRHEDPQTREHRHHQERSASWRCDPDGMITITARLAPADAAKVCAGSDQQVPTPPAPAGASLRQQRADALVATVTQGGTDVTTEIVVHVRGDAYDHIQPYPQGGPTTTDNLQKLCGPHNRQRHETRL